MEQIEKLDELGIDWVVVPKRVQRIERKQINIQQMGVFAKRRNRGKDLSFSRREQMNYYL